MNGGQKVVDFWRAPQAFATPEEASISYPHIEKIIESGMVLDLGCINRRGSKERAIGKEGVVRIKGKLCITSATRTTFKGINHISVKNLTNGYEGTIFIQDKLHAFVTDYLVLKEGKNLISVEWQEGDSPEKKSYLAEVFEPARDKRIVKKNTKVAD
jgi:hypothetical protein